MFSSKTFDQPHLTSSSKYCIEEAGDMTIKSLMYWHVQTSKYCLSLYESYLSKYIPSSKLMDTSFRKEKTIKNKTFRKEKFQKQTT